MKKIFIIQTQLIKLVFVLSLSWFGAITSAIAQQNCNTNFVETAPAARFIVNGDGTVTDRQTGLMWAQCPQGLVGENCSGTLSTFNWTDALALNQASSDTQNRDDWRLPNIKELVSLVEFACSRPAINLTVFPNTADTNSLIFWSSSPVAESFSAMTRVVQFNSGVDSVSDRASLQAVRLVRGRE